MRKNTITAQASSWRSWAAVGILSAAILAPSALLGQARQRDGGRGDAGRQQAAPAPAPARPNRTGDIAIRREPAAPPSRPVAAPVRREPVVQPYRPSPAQDIRGSGTQQNRPSPAQDIRGGTQQNRPSPARDIRGSGTQRRDPTPVVDRQPNRPVANPAPRPANETRPGTDAGFNRRTDQQPNRPVANPAPRPANGTRPRPVAAPPVPVGGGHSGSAFARPTDARRFHNGVTLRPVVRYTDRRWDAFFPSHTSSYPYYGVTYSAARYTYSPFRFFRGVLPPYIERTHVRIVRPAVVYVSVPIYVDGVWNGYSGDADAYYLNQAAADDAWQNDTSLESAVSSLQEAFRNNDIDALASLTDSNTPIAVFGQGAYEYSLGADDYLEMTSDFMRTSRTTGFDVYRVREKTDGVYQVFARHAYIDGSGSARIVYICMVLQQEPEGWTITQIDTSPDRQ